MFEFKLEELQTQVDQVKIDLASLKAETSEENKRTRAEAIEKDVAATKEAIKKELDLLKGSTDVLSVETTKKLEAMLVALETSNAELAILKSDITLSPIVPDTENVNKETEKGTEEKEEEKKGDRNRIQRQWDGVTSGQERKENTGANIARSLSGLGILAIGVRGINKLFGGGKKNKQEKTEENTSPTSQENEEEPGFWRSTFGKILKWTGIGTGAYYITHGFATGKRGLTDFFNRQKKDKEQEKKKEEVEVLQTEVTNIKKQVEITKKEEDPNKKIEAAENIQKVISAKREDISKKIEALKKDGEEKNADEIKKLEAMLVELDIYQREIEKIQGVVSDASEVDTSNPTGETKEDETSDWENAPAAAATMVVGGTTGWVVGNFLKRTKFASEAVSETMSVAKLRRNMDDIVKLLEVRLRDKQLLPIQKENIEKSIKYFSDARDNANAIEDVKIRKKLGDKLPIETLQKLDIDPDLAKKLRIISSDPDLTKKLANATSDVEIKKLFALKNIDDAPKELVDLLKFANKADEVRDITRVLAAAKPIKALAKGLRAIPCLDIAAAGIDVRMYFNEAREADLIKKTNELRGTNKQQQANMHLVLAGVDFAVGVTAVCLTCAASGPPGWIVGVVVLAAAGITMGVREIADTYYYDVVDFYTRNKEDYLSLYRMEIKQAILQATVRGDSSFPLSGSEQFTELFNWSNSVDENKTVTLEDAYRTMIYLEERNNYPTVATLNPNYPKEIDRQLEGQELENYTQEKEQLDQVMKLRMEYIKKFLPHATTNNHKSEYDAYISSIKHSGGISAIEQIVVDSKIYQTMKEDAEFTEYTEIKKYEMAKIEKLKTENEQRFAQLEAMYAKDPLTIVELYYNVINYDFVVKNEESYKETYQGVLPQITFIKKYYEAKFDILPIEQKIGLGMINDIAYVEVEKMLQNMDNGKIELQPKTFNETEIKQRLIDGNELARFDNSHSEYTSNIGQNIIYRIAKEVHGYEGANNDLDLMLYFSPDKKDSLGIYFDDGWYMNVNNGSDREFTLTLLDKTSPETILYRFFSAYFSYDNTIDNIDTSTENSDDVLNLEYRNRVSKIVKEEKSFQTVAKRIEIQKEIREYILKYGKDAYVKLPYNLVNDAKRAGLGNVEYFYYTYKGGVIHACTTKAYVDEVITLNPSLFGGFAKIQKEYVGNVRETLSEGEQKYIDYVENAHKRLMELRNVKSWTSHEDELDLPEEFEKMIGDKYKDWQNFKETLLGYSPEIAKEQLLSNYLGYHSYFEDLYMSILIELSGRNFSNDIDGYEYLVSVLSKMGAGYFDFDKKTLKDDILTKKQTEIYYKVLEEEKVFGKTIKALIMSSDEEEQQKGFWAAKQVLKTFLESQTVSLDDYGKISSINSGEITERVRTLGLGPIAGIATIAANIDYDITKSNVMDEMKGQNLKEELYLSPIDRDTIDTSTIESKSAEEIDIKKLTQKEQKTYKVSAATLKKIEDTQENVVWQDQRGNLIFDPEKSTITSRGASVKIDLDSMKVEGLNITYSNLLELLYMANLINRTKGKFLKENPGSRGIFFFGSRTDTLYVNDGRFLNGYNDTDVVSKYAVKEKYPKLLSESNQKTFINYINKV